MKQIMTIAEAARELDISVQATWKSLHRHEIHPEFLTPKMAVLTQSQFEKLIKLREAAAADRDRG